MAESDVPLVFIHGLKGSRLVSPTRGVLWVDPSLLVRSSPTGAPPSGSPAVPSTPPATPASPARSRFSFFKSRESTSSPSVNRTLSLPLDWVYDPARDLFVQARDDVAVDGIVMKVMWRKVYSIVCNFGKEHCAWTGRSFYVFTYDWRRDNWEHLDAYEKFLDDIVSQSKAPKGVQVIAHSNGGILTYSLMQKRPDLFHSVCFASVPFKPGVYGLPDLHHGNSVGFNKTILSADVLFSFASPWLFFPLLEDSQSWLVDHNGLPLQDEYDAYDPETWKALKFSVFSDPNLTPEKEAQYMAHLKAVLHQGQKYRRTFLSPTSILPSTVPVVVLGSKNRTTVTSVMVNGPKAVKGYDFLSAPQMSSDGRVPYHAIFPPSKSCRVWKVYHSDQEHGHLMGDSRLLEEIVFDLFAAKKKLADSSSGQLPGRPLSSPRSESESPDSTEKHVAVAPSKDSKDQGNSLSQPPRQSEGLDGPVEDTVFDSELIDGDDNDIYDEVESPELGDALPSI